MILARHLTCAGLALLVAAIGGCQATVSSSPAATSVVADTVTDVWLDSFCAALERGIDGNAHMQAAATAFRANELDNAAASARLSAERLREADELFDAVPPWEPANALMVEMRSWMTAQIEAADLMEQGATDGSPEDVDLAIERLDDANTSSGPAITEALQSVPGFTGCSPAE
jgi:hypothetical protein